MHAIRALGLCLLIYTGCNYNHVKMTRPNMGVINAEISANPDFKAVQDNVLGPRCLSCHSNAGGNQGGVNLESYGRVHGLLSRIAFRTLERRDMPPRGGLSEAEAGLLRTWMDNGSLETLPIGAEKPDPSLNQGPNDWAKVRDKIFMKKCADCHSGVQPAANLDIMDIKQVRDKVLTIFDRVIIKGDMPVAPYPAMTPKERTVLLQWFNVGLPQ